MQIRKTLAEAAVILIISLLLSVLFCIVSPTGRILLKKGLRIKTTNGAIPVFAALWSGP